MTNSSFSVNGVGGGGPGSGTVNSAAANSVAYYPTSGSAVSGLAPLANSILATNGSSIPALTQTMPNAVQLSANNYNSGTGASSSTFLRGDGTWATPAGSGTINPGLANQLPYYAANGSALTAFGPANNSILVTSGAGIPSLSQTMPTTVQLSASNYNNGTGATVNTYLRGDGTWAVPGAASQAVSVWCTFSTWNGNAGFIRGFNVASLAYNGVGDVTINFQNPLSSSNYAAVGTVGGFGPGGGSPFPCYMQIPKAGFDSTTTSVRIQIAGSTGAATEAQIASVIIFG